MFAGARKDTLSSLVAKLCEKASLEKSTHPTASGPPRSSGDLEAGLEKNIPARMPPAGSLSGPPSKVLRPPRRPRA